MSGWALGTFSTRDKHTMITIWNSQIRPILDYCSPLWSPRPWNYKEIDLLEETLRTFTRRIDGMEGYDYAERLKALNQYSIQRRHERYKIIYAYKLKKDWSQTYRRFMDFNFPTMNGVVVGVEYQLIHCTTIKL